MQQELNESLLSLNTNSSNQKKNILSLFSELQSLSQNFKKIQQQLPLKIQNVKPTKILPKKTQKKQLVVKEKDLFKRYISKTTFLNIMSFLPMNKILSFRLLSSFSNYLIESNVPFLIQKYEKKYNLINSLAQSDLYVPVLKTLYHISQHLVKLKKSIEKKNTDTNPKLLTYINFLFELQMSSVQRVIFKNPNQSVKLENLIKGLKISKSLIDWFNLNERQRKIIQQLKNHNIEQDTFQQYQNYTDLKHYLLKLMEFSSQPQYYLICNVHKKTQVLPKLQKSINLLNKVNLKIISRSNFLPKIEKLGKSFFQNVCSFLEYKNLLKFRLVCKTFNHEFIQNVPFYNHQIMRRINCLQSSYNMNLFQEQQMICQQDPSIHERLLVLVQEKGVISGKKTPIEQIFIISPWKIVEAISNAGTVELENIICERFGVDSEREASIEQLVSEMLAYYKQQSIINELPKLQKQQLALDKFETLYQQ